MNDVLIGNKSWEESDEPQLMLRVETPEPVKLLPYAHLVEITFEEGQPANLKLEYTSCVVDLIGKRLEEILPALQEYRVKVVRIGSRIEAIKISGKTNQES